METDILTALKSYQQALIDKNYSALLDILYHDDLIEYQNVINEFAEKMAPFGETDDFLKMMKIESVEKLKQMQLIDFVEKLFSGINYSIGGDEVVQFLNTMEIESVEHVDVLANVKYSYENVFSESGGRMTSEINLIRSGDDWKIMFKAGLRQSLQRFEKGVNDYYARKAKDNIEDHLISGYLERYELHGYRTEEGHIPVIEARFADAGDFSEDMAAVRIFRYWGYIDKKGELVIKPQFKEAGEFSDGLAYVRKPESHTYGFINKKGKLVISDIYEEAQNFNEDRCAVCLDDKWGYINTKGETVIPFKFESAGNFYGGEANVAIISEKGEEVFFVIDTEGNMVDDNY